MKKLISISEVVSRVELPEGPADVLATAEASYDEAHGLVEVKLDSAAVRADIRPGPAPDRPHWLLRPAVIRESVGLEDAVAEARLVFAHWVRQVRQAIPLSANLEPALP